MEKSLCTGGGVACGGGPCAGGLDGAVPPPPPLPPPGFEVGGVFDAWGRLPGVPVPPDCGTSVGTSAPTLRAGATPATPGDGGAWARDACDLPRLAPPPPPVTRSTPTAAMAIRRRDLFTPGPYDHGPARVQAP